MNSNLKEKKDKYNKVVIAFNNKIDSLINNFEKCKLNNLDSIDTIVFKKYIELGEVKKVSDYLNAEGYKVKTKTYLGCRKYGPNDITNILKNKQVEQWLIDAVEEMKSIDKLLIKMSYKNLLNKYL